MIHDHVPTNIQRVVLCPFFLQSLRRVSCRRRLDYVVTSRFVGAYIQIQLECLKSYADWEEKYAAKSCLLDQDEGK